MSVAGAGVRDCLPAARVWHLRRAVWRVRPRGATSPSLDASPSYKSPPKNDTDRDFIDISLKFIRTLDVPTIVTMHTTEQALDVKRISGLTQALQWSAAGVAMSASGCASVGSWADSYGTPAFSVLAVLFPAVSHLIEGGLWAASSADAGSRASATVAQACRTPPAGAASSRMACPTFSSATERPRRRLFASPGNSSSLQEGSSAPPRVSRT